MIGETIGNYRILSVLGEGGMGRVYLGEHALIGKRVAIKVLLQQFSANPDIVNRFFKEARASSLLKHAGVVDMLSTSMISGGCRAGPLSSSWSFWKARA